MTDNTQILRGLYDAFAIGDIPSVLGVLSPSARWTEAAGGPYGGVSIGPQAVLDNVFMKIGGEWTGFAGGPGGCVAQGVTVVGLGDSSGTYKATGKSFTAPFAHVWKFEAGKVASFHQHTDTAVHLRPLQPD